MKNASGNFLDDDELDGVVGGYDSVVEIMPDSSGQGMQPWYLSSRDSMSGAVVQTGSSGNTLVARAKEFQGDTLEGDYGRSSDMGQGHSVSLSDLVTEARMYSKRS